MDFVGRLLHIRATVLWQSQRINMDFSLTYARPAPRKFVEVMAGFGTLNLHSARSDSNTPSSYRVLLNVQHGS